ncbi:MAG: glycosyltransferase family A protein [Chlamydiales bacterium]
MGRKISVVIPVWNGAAYLAEAIQCALDQDYPYKEVIVVNDGSTDRSEEVIETFEGRIQHVYQENKGLGASRNRGVQLSTGEILAFLDQDDLWTREKLSRQMGELDQHASEDPLIFSSAEQFICPSLSEEERNKISISQTVLPGYIAGTLLVSKIRFFQIGYFFEEKGIGEFLDWYSRAHAMNVPVRMLSEILFYRRIHRTNMGRQPECFCRSDYLKVLKRGLERRRNYAL